MGNSRLCTGLPWRPSAGPHRLVQGLGIKFLVKELKIPHALWPKTKTENRNNIATNSIKTKKKKPYIRIVPPRGKNAGLFIYHFLSLLAQGCSVGNGHLGTSGLNQTQVEQASGRYLTKPPACTVAVYLSCCSPPGLAEGRGEDTYYKTYIQV